MLANQNKTQPVASFYELAVSLNNGDTLHFSALKGKKVLLVNTASDCGYTPQYNDLEALYEENRDKLVIIGFPANDFGQQEKGSDANIAAFCQLNFGVTFPLARKSRVVKSPEQNAVFRWLTDRSYNGWNDRAPVWNFSKYLVDEQGVLVNYFDPAIEPGSDEFRQALASI